MELHKLFKSLNSNKLAPVTAKTRVKYGQFLSEIQKRLRVEEMPRKSHIDKENVSSNLVEFEGTNSLMIVEKKSSVMEKCRAALKNAELKRKIEGMVQQ